MIYNKFTSTIKNGFQIRQKEQISLQFVYSCIIIKSRMVNGAVRTQRIDD